MWRENDFRGTQSGITGTLLISIVKDILNPKLNVPTLKGVDSYVKSAPECSSTKFKMSD